MVDHQSKLHRFSFGAILVGFTAPVCMTAEKRSILQRSGSLQRFQLHEKSFLRLAQSIVERLANPRRSNGSRLEWSAVRDPPPIENLPLFFVAMEIQKKLLVLGEAKSMVR
jgi:hypothetical protein